MLKYVDLYIYIYIYIYLCPNDHIGEKLGVTKRRSTQCAQS